MSDFNSTARIDLVANGQQPENQLARLKQRAEDLRDAIAKAAKEGDKASCAKWEKELKKVRREIKNVQDATQNVNDVMRRLDTATPKELKATLRSLEKQLQNIERGSRAWDEQTEKIRKVKTVLAQVNSELAAHETRWQKITRLMNSWQTTIIAALGAFTGLVMTGKKAVNAYAEMEQEMANVRKFTGMTAEQVEELNEEFKKIDTRSSREELNRLAQEAGRLGKQSEDDVLGFVRAADQINVALDDLGDGATLQISKLTQIFGDEERLGTEKALLSVGSVINELSQNCAASAPYLADFASRLGGVGAQAGMTVQQIMGIAAVLDSKGQQVEASATAISQVITRMYQDPAKYAKAAGIDIQYFTELVRTDANEALMVLSETLNAKGGLKDTAPIFKEMGENGARAVAALATLAENIQEVRSQQEVANQAFEEATSVTEEFNVQNNTVQAGLDKAKNRFNELAVALGQKLLPVMRYAISSASAIMRVMSLLIDFTIKYYVQLVEIAVAIAAYNVVVNIAVIKTKSLAAWTAIVKGATYGWMVVQQAWNVVLALCSRNTHRLTQDIKLLAAMLKINPWGFAIAAITAVVVGLTTLIRKQSEAAQMQKDLNKIRQDASDKLVDEQTKIDLLVKAAQNEKLSLGERHQAIQKLNSIIPNYNAQLDATTGKYRANKKALDAYLESLRKKYELEGAKDVLRDIGKQRAQLLVQKDDLNVERGREQALVTKGASYHPGTNISTTGTAPGAGGGAATTTGASQRIAAIDREIQSVDNKIATLGRRREYILNNYGDALQRDEATAPEKTGGGGGGGTGGGGTGGGGTGGGTGGSNTQPDRFAAEKQWREQQEALNRIAYATGKKDYLSYTKTMDQIAVDYYGKLLEHTDLSATERLGFEADYAESAKKLEEQSTAESIDLEKNLYDEEMALARQRYLDGEYSKSTYDEAMERLEIEHQQRLVSIHKEGTAERAAAEARLQDLLISQMERKQKERERLEKQYEKMMSEYFGDTPSERQAKYEADLAMLTEIYDAEMAAAEDSMEDRLYIEEMFQKAKLALQKKYGLLAEEDTRKAMEKGIAKSIEWLNGDGGKALTGTLDTLVSGMSAIFTQLSSLMQADLEIQTAAINKRYDAEISRAEGNSYKVAKLEKDKEKEIAKAKKEANRKMFAMQVLQAIAQTAQGAISAYSSAAAIPVVGWVLAPIAAGMALAAGALQIAAIKKQQQASEAQGYSEGGFTPDGDKDKPVGIVHAGEWVASQRLTKNPATRPFIEALDYAQRTNTIGSFRTSDVTATATRTISADPDDRAATAILVNAGTSQRMADAVTRLNDRLDEPFVTVNSESGDYGMQQAREKYERLMKNKSPKTKK